MRDGRVHGAEASREGRAPQICRGGRLAAGRPLSEGILGVPKPLDAQIACRPRWQNLARADSAQARILNLNTPSASGLLSCSGWEAEKALEGIKAGRLAFVCLGYSGSACLFVC